jgi:hypothetical protein
LVEETKVVGYMDQNSSPTTSQDEDVALDQEKLIPFGDNRLEAGHTSYRIQWLYHLTATFLLSLIGASVLAYSFLTAHPNAQCRPGGFEHGHSTEFAPILPYISVEVEHPTGGFILSGNGTLEDTTSLYAGRPTPEIDQSWDQLLRGNEIVLPNDEAGSMKGKTVYDKDGGGWRFGLEVYHSLHCINLLRKQVDANYYNIETHEKQHLGQ